MSGATPEPPPTSRRGPPSSGAPHEMTAERAADLNRVADLGNIVEEGRDLAVLEALDDELVEPLQPGRRRNRVASLYLVSIRRGEPDVEVLAGRKETPVWGRRKKLFTLAVWRSIRSITASCHGT